MARIPNAASYDVEDHADARKAFVRLREEVDANLPSSRAKSLALTKLDEAWMWADAAIRGTEL